MNNLSRLRSRRSNSPVNRSPYSLAGSSEDSFTDFENGMAEGGVTAVIGIGYEVFKGIVDNKGDISWNLEKMEGAKHPYDQKEQYGKAPFKRKTLTVKGALSVALWGDELSATFELEYWYNGHSIGYITIEPVGTNDAPLWAMHTEAKIKPLPNAYRWKNDRYLAAVEVTFNHRFSRSIGDDRIYIQRFSLFGNGNYERRAAWTQ